MFLQPPRRKSNESRTFSCPQQCHYRQISSWSRGKTVAGVFPLPPVLPLFVVVLSPLASPSAPRLAARLWIEESFAFAPCEQLQTPPVSLAESGAGSTPATAPSAPRQDPSPAPPISPRR